MDHNKIQNIVLGYVNSLSKEELEDYNNNPVFDSLSASGLGISEYTLEQDHEACFRMISVLRSAMCNNQGYLIQYMFLAAEKHKSLRLFLDSDDVANTDALAKKVLELTSYIDGALKENIDRNLDYLYQYFDGRNIAKPRICIKGKSCVDDQYKIVRVFSDDSDRYNSGVDINKSTAYKYIKENGRYYIQNDIPTAVSKGEYENSRIDYDKVRMMKEQGYDLNDVWEDCWLDSDETTAKSNFSYYKSTLIVPITLLNNKLDPEFIYNFNTKIDNEVGESALNPNEIERTIFAFLCIDHVDRWFFDEENDVRFVYIIADLISFYLFLRTMYLEVSEVFSKSTQLLKNAGVELDFKRHVYAAESDRKIEQACFHSEEEYGATNKNFIAALSNAY
jgi:hypothetical protein